MKRRYLLSLILLVGISVFTSCGSSQKEEKSTEDKDLAILANEAIKDEDFGEAYELIDEMIMQGSLGHEYGQKDIEKMAEQLNTKAISAEFSYLLGTDLPVETKATKIILTVKERAKANVWRYDPTSSYKVKEELEVEKGLYENFITIAKAHGQTELADKLQEALNATTESLEAKQ